MKNQLKLFTVLVILLVNMILVPSVAANERTYIPDMKLTIWDEYSMQWVDADVLHDIYVGDPFRLRLEVSVLVSGWWEKKFGPKSIDTYIVVPQDNTIDMLVDMSDAKWKSFVYEGEASGKALSRNQRTIIQMLRRYNANRGWRATFDLINDFIPTGDRKITATIYSLPVMVTHNEKTPIKTQMIFQCTPNTQGRQPIHVFFQNEVSETHSKEFTITVR